MTHGSYSGGLHLGTDHLLCVGTVLAPCASHLASVASQQCNDVGIRLLGLCSMPVRQFQLF